MKIYIDHRQITFGIERLAKLQVLLGKQNVIVKQLQIGDYVDEKGLVGIEGKAPKDFCKSICDGKLWQQAEELCQAFKYPYIFVEGSIEEVMLVRGGMTWQSLLGVISSLLAHYQVPVVFADIFYEELLIKVMEKHQETVSENYSPLRMIKRTPATKEDWQVYILESFPGVGHDRAVSLLGYFGSLERVFKANATELCEVNNIGKGTAKKILEVLK